MMRMLKSLLCGALVVMAGSATAQASCFGTGTLRTCTDTSGNTYQTSRIGNSTFTNGFNAQNGTTWNQQSTRVGNTTMINGTAADGRSWNATINNTGSMRMITGTDSRGRGFTRTCTANGCF